MRKPRIVLIGKHECRDYCGARTLYVYNALKSIGIQCSIYPIDIKSDSAYFDSTHVIFLPWVQDFDKGWSEFLKVYNGRKILYTENSYWYDECRQKLIQNENVNMDDVFTTIAYSTSENIRWWPKQNSEYWGSLVDEDLALPKCPENYIYVDQIWPEEWSSGVFNANKLFNMVLPEVKRKFNIEIASQKSEESWVDYKIDENIDIEKMLSTIAKSKVYLTSHEESLGLMQIESLVCGVPVLTNPMFSKEEIFKAGDNSVVKWNWHLNKDQEIDFEETAKEFYSSFEKALDFNRLDIRKNSVELYGKQSFLKKSGFELLLSENI